MEQVEKQLEITPPMIDSAGPPVNERERDQFLHLAAQLATRDLTIEARLGLVEQMCQVLNHEASPDGNGTNENERRPRAPP